MAEPETEQSPRPSLSPTALPIRDTARLLTKAGASPVTDAMIQADVEAGAPKNADGTLNLVHYTAWLAQQFIGKLGESDVD